MIIDLQAFQQRTVLRLHVVWEDLDCEEAHLPLSVEEFELALDHDVEGFEQQRIEIFLDFLIVCTFLEVLESLGGFSYAKLSKKDLPMILSPCSRAKLT